MSEDPTSGHKKIPSWVLYGGGGLAVALVAGIGIYLANRKTNQSATPQGVATSNQQLAKSAGLQHINRALTRIEEQLAQNGQNAVSSSNGSTPVPSTSTSPGQSTLPVTQPSTPNPVVMPVGPVFLKQAQPTSSPTPTQTVTKSSPASSTNNGFITFNRPQDATVSALASNHPVSIVGLSAAQVGYLKNLAQKGQLAGVSASGKPIFKSQNPNASLAQGHATVTVQPGNTLWGIAQAHHMSLSSLEAANPQIKNPNLIYPGQKITL